MSSVKTPTECGSGERGRASPANQNTVVPPALRLSRAPTEAKRHAKILEQIANIKSTIAPDFWEGDDWDELEPQIRRLLNYMHGREKADLHVLCPAVWGKDYLTDKGVTEAARETTRKANKFLQKRQSRWLLEKVRKEPYLRWG